MTSQRGSRRVGGKKPGCEGGQCVDLGRWGAVNMVKVGGELF